MLGGVDYSTIDKSEPTVHLRITDLQQTAGYSDENVNTLVRPAYHFDQSVLRRAIDYAGLFAADEYIRDSYAAKAALESAVETFQNSEKSSELDKNDLADGVYSVYVDMIKMDRNGKSMSDNAINHIVKLEVKDGEYFVTLDFRGITIENRFGYLKSLAYYADGYSYNQYGAVSGTLVPVDVLTTQKDSDGNDIIDQYNDAGNLYPDLVTIKLMPQAIADPDGYAPLHVFVPIMEFISEGNGAQDVLMKVDWSTLKATTNDDPSFRPEEPEEQSPAVDFTDKATGVTVRADKGVLPAGVQIIVTEITSGSDYDAAGLCKKGDFPIPPGDATIKISGLA